MKQTITRVGVLCFLGLGAVAYAQEGRVGINTTEPKATLEITPKASNLTGTTNEGLIIPQLTKARVKAIATPVEGTKIYVTDEVLATDTEFTGTGKGFYFYNGTKWAKQLDSDTNTNIWQKQAGKEILLVDTDIQRKVQYQPTGGLYTTVKDITGRFYNSFNRTARTTNVHNLANTNAEYESFGGYNYQIVYGDQLPATPNNASFGNFPTRIANRSVLSLDNKDTSSVGRVYESYSNLNVSSNSTKSYASIYANVNEAAHWGTGTIGSLMGQYNVAVGYPAGVTTKITGGYNQAITYSDAKVPHIEGAYSLVSVRSKGEITNAIAARNHLQLDEEGSNIQYAEGLRVVLDANPSYAGTVGMYKGAYIYSDVKKATGASFNEAYGLYVGAIDFGKTLNYSIFTNEGKVRVGDLADTTATADRNVVVDKDGVLKVGTAGANFVATTAGMVCNATNRGKMNFVPNDSGSDIFGICLKNADGNYYWGYMVGGNNPTNGTGAFGSGITQ